MTKQWWYQNVKHVVVKNQDLSKNIKQVKYQVINYLGLKTLLSKIPLLDDTLFWMKFHWRL